MCPIRGGTAAIASVCFERAVLRFVVIVCANNVLKKPKLHMNR